MCLYKVWPKTHFDAVRRETGRLQRDSSQVGGGMLGGPWCNLPMTVGRPTRTSLSCISSPLSTKECLSACGGVCVCVLSLSNFFLPLVTLNYGEAEALVSRPGHGMKKKIYI